MFWVRRSILFILFLVCITKFTPAQRAAPTCVKSGYAGLTHRISSYAGLSSLWYDSSSKGVQFRTALLYYIDSLYRLRLIVEPYHQNVPLHKRLSPAAKPDSISSASCLIGALVATSFDLFRGADMYARVGYDAVSQDYTLRDDSLIEFGIRSIDSESKLRHWLFSLEPSQKEYKILRTSFIKRQTALAQSKVTAATRDTLQQLENSIHLYRWLFHFGIDRFLVVNIPGASLTYYGDRVSVFSMRAIVGKPATPTPRFASYCTKLILYPYWYVPSSIAIAEYLPKIKKNPAWLDQRNMQVIDGQGRVVDHHRLNWRSFHAGYFPYTIRQSTGCDNALGVLKLDIETPYGVYLHDTNHKGAFLQDYRFLSHGCIRLEEPLLLGSMLLEGKLDTAYLESCFKDKKPIPLPLRQPVAVFSLYMSVTVDQAGYLQFWPDPYRLHAGH